MAKEARLRGQEGRNCVAKGARLRGQKGRNCVAKKGAAVVHTRTWMRSMKDLCAPSRSESVGRSLRSSECCTSAAFFSDGSSVSWAITP